MAAKSPRFLPADHNPFPYLPSDAAQVRPKAEDHALDVVPRVALNLVSWENRGVTLHMSWQPCA